MITPEERARLRAIVDLSEKHQHTTVTVGTARLAALLDALEAAETDAEMARSEYRRYALRGDEYQRENQRLTEDGRLAMALADQERTRAERAEADLAAMTGFRDECERQYQAAIHAQGQAEADLADEKRRHAELRAEVEALADELECPPHYRDNPEALAWHVQNCHGCEKGSRVRAALRPGDEDDSDLTDRGSPGINRWLAYQDRKSSGEDRG